MIPVTRVANPPAKPLLVFDGECRFCTLWVRRWKQISGEAVEFHPYQDSHIALRFPEIPRAQFESAAQLIATDGSVSHGAEAAFRARAFNPEHRWALRAYERFPIFRTIADAAYRTVANNRRFFSLATRIGWGEHVERPEHLLVRRFFLRTLAVIYCIAFVSLWMQVSALIGSHGILPVRDFLSSVGNVLDARGIGLDRYRILPTLCWFNASDAFLNVQCGAGVLLSLLLFSGVAQRVCLAGLWALYLSLSVAGQTFLAFQWDTLLLETGFFAAFLAPGNWLAVASRETPPSRLANWLLRWLLFRLMFQSGLTKLLYDDPTWLHCSALTFHYETQPLPTWIGWYAHQLPLWSHKFSCAAMFGIELVLPFLFFAPRRLRIFAAAGTCLLQLLIGLTGNYNFFNLLTAALCIPLLDDAHLRWWCGVLRLKKLATLDPPKPRLAQDKLRKYALGAFAVVAITITSVEMFQNFGCQLRWAAPAVGASEFVAPLRTFNSYGLFRVMTRPRYEIVIEGSRDGMNWLAYEFKYKPGDLRRAPGFVEPHQPRLDWQMWFAALSDARQQPWFVAFSLRLLEGSPEVLALMEKDPFPEQPPRFIRAQLYVYRFTNAEQRRRTGEWWQREFRREYLPPVSLKDFAR